MSKAIFLGTFNPPHKGHKNVIESVWSWHLKNHEIDLEQIYIIPCWQNPNKNFVTSYWDRYKMCRNEFALLGDYCVLDDIEEQIQPKYTYELLDYFHSNKDIYIKDDFWWIITNETFKEILDGKWKESKRLLKENKFILLEENHDQNTWSHYYDIQVIQIPLFSHCTIHSTQLRNMVKNNENLYPYLNLGTQIYIKENNLYK